MRVLLRGSTLRGQLTGVGHYTRQLLQHLVLHPAISAVGVFDGGRIYTALPATTAAATDLPRLAAGKAARFERLKALSAYVPWRRPLAAWFDNRRFQKATRASQWDLCHEPAYVGPAFAGPLVTTIHDLCCWRYPQYQPADRVRWYRGQVGQTLRRTEAVVVVSEFTKRELLHYYPWMNPQRVFVTPLAVDVDAFEQAVQRLDVEQVRRQWNLPERFILFLGTLEPRKNLRGLAEAYARLPKPLQHEYPLVLAGTVGWRQTSFRPLLEKLQEQGVVRETGYLPQEVVPALLQLASVFCFPSHYEGFGLPPLEAAAMGTPVLCANTASLPEVMGGAALYVDPNYPEDIEDGLRLLLEDSYLQSRLRRLGPEQARRFSWAACVDQTLVAYRAALGETSCQQPHAA